MNYERAEFDLVPPIRENVGVGSVPKGTELKRENGVITGLWVNIGADVENKIKGSNYFKNLFEGAESKKEIGAVNNALYVAVKYYGTQKAGNFINSINFELDSPTYDVCCSALVKRLPTGQLQYTREEHIVTGNRVKNDDYRIDVGETEDEDNFLGKLYHNYNMGLKHQNDDPVASYRYFYSVTPKSYEFTSDEELNSDLKLIRDAISHDILNNPKHIKRAKILFGEEYILKDKSDEDYTYINESNSRHINLIRMHIPTLRKCAREYINKYLSDYHP